MTTIRTKRSKKINGKDNRHKDDPEPTRNDTNPLNAHPIHNTHKSSSSRLPTLDEELHQAMETVLVTKARAKQLHESWIQHLLRLSYLVSFLSMYQAQYPFKDCILAMKKSSMPMSSWKALYLVMGRNMCEVINMTISFLLFYFLSLCEPSGDFSSWSFMTTSALVPLCLGLFYNQRKQLESIPSQENVTLFESTESNQVPRQFPVATIFYFIVLGCFGFMKMGMTQYEKNVELVERLQVMLQKKKAK